jgi:CRP-like cAMP-binding protein
MKLKPEQQTELLALLPKLSLFQGMSSAALGGLVGYFEVEMFAKNKVILMEQEVAQKIYVLVSGRVSITRMKKGEKNLLTTMTAPNFFGELSTFAGSSANAQVKAFEECRIFTIRKEDLELAYAKDPGLKAQFMKNLETIRMERNDPAKRDESVF